MKQESYEKVFEVCEAQDSFSDWLNKPYISQSLREKLSEANLLIVPIDDINHYKGPVFPSGTEELFLFLKENATNGMIPEICIEEEDYVELVQHWDLITIGSMILSCVLVPLAINFIYDYIKSHYGSKLSKTQVKLEITIEDNKTHIHYKGPVEELLETILPAIQDMSKK